MVAGPSDAGVLPRLAECDATRHCIEDVAIAREEQRGMLGAAGPIGENGAE